MAMAMRSAMASRLRSGPPPAAAAAAASSGWRRLFSTAGEEEASGKDGDGRFMKGNGSSSVQPAPVTDWNLQDLSRLYMDKALLQVTYNVQVRPFLASLPSCLHPPPLAATAAASGWRRLLSTHSYDNIPEEDGKKDEGNNGLEGHCGHGNTSSSIHLDPDLSWLLKAVLSKQALEFEKKFNEQVQYFEMRKREIQLKAFRDVQSFRRSLIYFNDECLSRNRVVKNGTTVLMEKHRIIKNSEGAIILQARVSLLKGIAWMVLSVLGGSITIALRLSGNI